MRTDAASATWPEADEACRRGAPAVLPFGALEQHGPHLPLSTDTIMATELAARVADAIDGWLLPVVPLGDTEANNGFPGTLSLSFDTVRAIAVDISRSLHRSGWRCLIVVNGDYGNQAPLRTAARDVDAALGWPVLVIDYPGLAEAAAQLCETPPAGPGFYHADEVETSVILALRPDLVHLERAVAGYPEMPATLGAAPTDLAAVSPSGVFGDPRPADAGKGAALLDFLEEKAVALARSFLATRVPARGQTPHGQPTVGPGPG
jgi:creatinine amidohydrolase